MHKSKVDVAVLILFFNRPQIFAKTFEQIRQVRPSKLYLYQDGPREGRPDDIENIAKCREIVSNIDWECEVHTKFQEKNYGCDPSNYMAQKWMFQTEEMGIVLEDDDVVAQSFFPFCKELLEKYKDDERINMICGMNNLEINEGCPYDYFFTKSGSITGWASWKRVIDEWKDHVEFINDEYAVQLFTNAYKDSMNVEKYLDRCRFVNNSGVAYYESILSACARTQNRINIVATRNMVCNIGNEGESTHGVTSIDFLPKGLRRIFNMKTYEIEFPIKHPPYVIDDVLFHERIKRVMGEGHPFVRLYRKFEAALYRVKAHDFTFLSKRLKRIFKK